MKAILMTAVDVLQLQEVPTPKISQPHQVLVALKAAGVNPIDTKIRKRGTFYPEQMPAILGCDGAGIVEAVGAAVQDFRPGDEVYFCNGGLGKAGTGNYAEYALIEADYLAHKPKSLSVATFTLQIDICHELHLYFYLAFAFTCFATTAFYIE